MKKDGFHKKSVSTNRTDQQRKIKTQEISQRGLIKARPLGATNYEGLDSEMKNNHNNNILVLPPVSSNHNNHHNHNKESKVQIQKNQEPIFDNNSQSNIVESPNLKKAISKYSEVPEMYELNKDMSALTKVKL